MKFKIKRAGRLLARMAEKGLRPFCSAVIVAAGSSSRMQGTDKLTADLCGKPVILRTLEAFQSAPCIDEIILVTKEDKIDGMRALAASEGITKLRNVVAGGDTRPESVMAGLTVISPKAKLVAVHDGDRPLVTGKVIEGAVDGARSHSAAAPAVAVKDTIKIAKNGCVDETPDRKTLFAVQTPQTFAVEVLLAGLQTAEKKKAQITDDCSAAELIGVPVWLSKGDYANLKITTPEDMILAEALWKAREMG